MRKCIRPECGYLEFYVEDAVVLYIHGKGGNASEAEHYRQFFPGKDVYGFDYKSQNPWEAKKEFGDMIAELSEKLILKSLSQI